MAPSGPASQATTARPGYRRGVGPSSEGQPASSTAPGPESAAGLPPAGLEAVVRAAAHEPVRGRWSRARLERDFCARSPRRVAADADLAFTAPCADLSALTAWRLAAAGFAPVPVLCGIRRPLQGTKLQCGLEVEDPGRTWVIGFGVSSVYLYAGRFLPTPRRPWVLRGAPGDVDPDRPFLAWFTPEGRAGVHHLLPGYDLAADVRHHARRNHALGLWWARRRALDPRRAAHRGCLPDAPGRWA